MTYPKDLKFTKTHEWMRTLKGGRVQVGISDYAQQELGDIVFVNLPETGDGLTAGEAFADVESVKAVADVLSPVSGKVAAVNGNLLDSPEKINEDCYEAWFIEAEDAVLSDGLMDAAAYEAFCAAQE